MDQKQRDILKKKILKRYELYLFQYSRVKRILKDPLRTIPWFVVNAISHLKPFKVKYTTLWGDKMTFYLPEGNAIYYYGFFEANLTNFFINFLREGDIFFDVGSHVGFYSVLTSRLVADSGQVHSFEPTPRTFVSLRKNMFGRKNSFVNNRAVMDTETEIEFTDYGPKYSAFNSFKNRSSNEMNFLSASQKIKVKTISLDTYCSQKKLIPTIIKIDAEGAEHIILNAMKNILLNKKTIITIEVAGGDEWKDNCDKSIDLLMAYGYRAFEITLEGYLKAHKKQASYIYDNLVFAHESNLGRLQKLIR